MTISTAPLNLCMGTWACRFRTFRRDRNHRMHITNCFVWKRYLEAEGKRQKRQATFTRLRGFRAKIAKFSRPHCLAFSRRGLRTKKTKRNIEK